MKSIIQSFIIAFSMYSKIPMPKDNWEEKNLRYAMCFFPFVGIAVGAVLIAWYYIAGKFHAGNMVTTVFLVVLPIMLTGGIHMDGFLDTVDALSSNQGKEKRLEILSDPHTGAFAIIFCGVYYLLSFCFWHEISNRSIMIVAIGFVLSRSLSALSVVNFKKAKDTGLAYTFSNSAVRKTVSITSAIMAILCAAAMLYLNPGLGVIALCSSGAVFLYYRYKAYKSFGGITGDLCGYFLQLCELAILICVVGGDKIWYS